MNKDRFDELFEQAINKAVNKKSSTIELKERFSQIEDNKNKIKDIFPESTQTDLILELGRKAAFMHTQPISTNSLPISDETILMFLNSNDESDSEVNEIEEKN